MSQTLQGFGEYPGNLHFIVDDEDRLGADRGEGRRHGRAGRWRGWAGRRRGRERELDVEDRSRAGSAHDRDRAVVLLDDPLAQRQPEARTVVGLLGREGRLEELGLVGMWDYG